ncbi:MAG: hypothetical protein MJ246_06235 [Clostridia bacterium]|nr:hypothetical protein [Clostridia bacterium]
MLGENKPQTEKAKARDVLKKGQSIMTFCEYCEDFVEAKVFSSQQDVYDFGKRAFFDRLDLVCTRCGRYIEDEELDEINDANQSIIE